MRVKSERIARTVHHLLHTGMASCLALAAGACSSESPGGTTTGDMLSTGGGAPTSTGSGTTTGGDVSNVTGGNGTPGTTSGPPTGTTGAAVDANGNTSTGGDTTGTTAGNGTTGGQLPDPSACDASAAPSISTLGLETVVTDSRLQSLVYAAQPEGSDDWFLMELTGKVWVYTDGAIRDTVFLDLSDQISLNPGYDERGMLGMALAPDYAQSGKVYLAMVPTQGDFANHDLLIEYTRSAADPYVADLSSRREIVDLPPGGQDLLLNDVHNCNTPMFGPDGMLYLGIGDGGGDCNSARPGAPQDPSEPYGKILRLDPNAPAPHAAADNPFADSGDPRVYQMGLRNPFRFSFDSATGDLYIGDVGQWAYEELDVAPAGMTGLNFGWPDFEAEDDESCENGASLRAGDTHTSPIHVIPHGTNGGALALVMSVVGGVVYRGQTLPDLYGVYLFGEYYATRPMGALTYCKGETSPVVTILKRCDPNTPDQACFNSDGAPLAEVGAILEGSDKEIYLPANGNTLFKIVPAQ